MKVLQRLTLENLRRNKRRTIVTIIGVILSSALILAVVGMVTSFQKMMINYAKAERGDFHEMYQEVPVEALKYIENNTHVESYYYSRPLAKQDVDEDVWDSYETYQHTPYKLEFYQKLDTLPADAKGKYNIFVRFDEPQKYQQIRQTILDAIEQETDEYINYRTHTDLLRYEANVMGDAALATLYSLAAIVIGIIIVTSVFVIRNSFSISASERARQFGMLSSIGATPRQIRRSIIFEGIVIGAIGIPLGILLGILAVLILVWVVNFLLQGMVVGTVEFSMPFWIFPVTIALSFITIFLSSLLPAIRTAKIPPIEAIRGNRDTKVKAKKLKTSKFVDRTFGIGGVIADKNLKRSRKKYRTTVVSIVLSVATFIGLYSFIGYGKDMTNLQYTNSEIDFAMQGDGVEIYRDLISRFQLNDSAYYMRHNRDEEIPIYMMSQTAFEKFAKSVGVFNNFEHAVLLNDHAMNQNNKGQYIDERLTDLKDGSIYHTTIYPGTPEECQEQVTEIIDGMSILTINVDEACVKKAGAEPFDYDFKITKVMNELPLGFEGYHGPALFVGEKYFERSKLAFEKNYNSQFFAAKVDDVKAITNYLETYFKEHKTSKEYYYEDVAENVSQMRRMYILISIFLYGFVIVVTLIGVTNIFNTITTNIALRAKEFAMLKSIGMTSKEFNRMVRLESVMYAGKALIIGLPLGLLLSYGFYASFANMVDFGWQIPWMAILISIIAVSLLIWAIMRYSVRQVEKQNIIETIRDENI